MQRTYTSMLPLLLCTLALGQTFQYSRGWTNGKRAPAASTLGAGSSHFHRVGDIGLGIASDDDVILPEIYEIQDGVIDRKLEKCLVQLQRFVRNPLLPRVANTSPNYSSGSSSRNNNNNNNNNLFGTNRHQSNELFEELNAAAAASAVEPNDYGKH